MKITPDYNQDITKLQSKYHQFTINYDAPCMLNFESTVTNLNII